MPPLRPVDSADRVLIQIVDAALAEAEKKSGRWLVCRPGCTQCCIGPFPINQLDAMRLRQGLAELETRDQNRAAWVRRRARESAARLSHGFPGDPNTGILDRSEEAEERFAGFADDEPCPALDPETGNCDLYAARPITCRAFGPPVRFGSESIGICELCFQGASDAEITACEMEVDPDRMESALLAELERATGVSGETIVAFALAS